MPKFLIVETIHSEKVRTVRLGTTSVQYGTEETGKPVKLTAANRYELAILGDLIEGVISSSNLADQGTQDGYAIGGIYCTGYKHVTFDGLQATPGTGAIAAGDYVYASTLVAKGTKLTTSMKVVKATDQAAAKAQPFKARVVSLGIADTGAVGTTGTIELF